MIDMVDGEPKIRASVTHSDSCEYRVVVEWVQPSDPTFTNIIATRVFRTLDEACDYLRTMISPGS